MMYVAKARLPKLCNCSTPHSLLPRAARACSSSLCRQQSLKLLLVMHLACTAGAPSLGWCKFNANKTR
eukprot:118767-Pelagomonas_calceolata.AAC.1